MGSSNGWPVKLARSRKKFAALRRKRDYVTLSIPKELYEKSRIAIEGTGFRSVTEYAIFLIRESLFLRPGETLKDRLRALGYMG